MVEYRNKNKTEKNTLAFRRKRRPQRPTARTVETEKRASVKTEAKPKKKTTVVYSISQVFRNLSISVNLTIYAIYLIYLLYSISKGVGIKVLNIVLAMVTAAFMVVYLILRLSGKKRGKELKQIKHYYKNFKLVTRATSAIVGVYALLTAVTSVSPLAIIIAFIGAVFLVIRLIVELVLFLIRRRIRKIKGERQEIYDQVAQAPTDKKKRKRKLWELTKKDEELEDVIVPIDECLLNDIDDQSTLFDTISIHID